MESVLGGVRDQDPRKRIAVKLAMPQAKKQRRRDGGNRL
jgi:hypothetical protein